MATNTINFTINLDGNAYSGMAKIDDALSKVLVNAKQTKRSLGDMFKELVSFSSLNNIVSDITQAFQTMVGTSLDFEQQQANLKTLLNGDAEATENLVKQIKEYSNATTYDTSSLVEAQKTMMAFGLDAEFAFEKLKNIGDIALGDQQNMQSLALAFSQMSSTGKLTGQDLNQMINAGFNPLAEISKKTGKSIGKLKEEVGKGKITVEQVASAFESATSEGGMFFEGAQNAADTTAGKIAKMNKTIDDLKIKLFEATNGATAYIAEIGNMILPLAQLSPLFTPLFKGSRKFFNSIKSAGGLFSLLKTNGIIALSSIGGWVKKVFVNWATHVKNVGLRFFGLKLKASAALAGVRSAIAKTKVRIISMGKAIRQAGGFFPWLAVKAKIACKVIGTAVKGIPVIGWIITIAGLISSLFVYLYTKFESVREWFDGVGSAVVCLLGPFGVLINIVVSFIKHWDSIKKAFTEGGILAGIKRIGFVIIDAMLKPIQSLLELLAKIPGLGNLASGGAEKIKSLRERLDKATNVEVLGSEDEQTEKEEKPKEEPKTQGGTLGKSAGTSAGKAQQINITLGSMVGTMNFNGGLQDNRRDIERQLTELMARVLGMAETAI